MKSNYLKIFGAHLRTARQARGWTQTQLATKTGRQRNAYISDVEHGKRSLTVRQAERFAKAVGVGLEEMFNPEIHGSIVVDQPGNPVAAPCAISGCQYSKLTQ